jgi:transposase InsO family protein
MDFTRVGGLLRSVVVGAVVDGFSRRVLAMRVAPREPRSAFAVRLLRAAVRRAGRAPKWVVTDHGSQFRAGEFRRAALSLGIRHRHGAVHRHGSVAVIERFWKSMKAEYAWSLCVWLPLVALERSLANYARWFNGWRPHQGLGQRTPAEVHAGRSTAPRSVPLRAVLVARRVAGDRLLPVLSLRLAA